MIILVGGGSRSGKSRHALHLAQDAGTKLAFLATAQAGDGEMQDRIARHQAERGNDFVTIEEPQRPWTHFGAAYDAIVVDCLTLWVSNLLLAGEDIAAATDRLVAAAATSKSTIIFVTNEVGCGIVPENELARRFRDEAGRVNQRVAEAADAVYWMVFGIAMKVKG
jgi:adenosylcobinamide kinase / adenosylcobinamide-phosphate guanylyltransferase